jgi:uncharacterized protein
MRAPADMPRRPRRREPGRGRVVLVVALVVLFVLYVLLQGLARVWTDQLWFESVDQEPVWRKILYTRFGLAAAFAAGFALLLWVNLVVADRLRPSHRIGARDELLVRYHDVVERRAWAVRAVISVVFGLVAGAGVASHWNEWLLFANGSDFGRTDPVFHQDVGFYVFKLPFLTEAVNTVFASVTLILVFTVVAHYLNGGIALSETHDRVTPAVKAHISVLLGVLALIKAGDYYLERFELTLSQRGYVDGAGYTDVQAQLPAIELLVVISLLSAVLFIWNIRRRGWVLPALAVGLWAVVAAVAGALYPELIQRFVVEPAESAREAPYIANNIDATREALGIDPDRVRRETYTGDETLTRADIEASQEQIAQVRLLTPDRNLNSFRNSSERGADYYDFRDLDIDNYPIDQDGDGEPEPTQVLIGVRELNQSGVPEAARSWEGTHLEDTYTHGYGVSIAPANEVNRVGEPNFVVSADSQAPGIDVGLVEGNPDARPEIYFGEGLTDYAIVNADYDEPGGEGRSLYTGSGGVPIGGFLEKAAFAARFSDLNPLISSFVGDDARLLHLRDVSDRLEEVAPFLAFDSDPYAVVIEGRIQWVVDAYTTSAWYPNAQDVDISDLPKEQGSESGLVKIGGFNYVRNSVKATVDAYDGSIKLYIVDNTDPIIAAYAKAFPSLFTAGTEVTPELKAHFRYPQDLFRLQTNMYARYHLSPEQFYANDRGWSVAGQPGEVPVEEVTATATGGQPAETTRSVSPIAPQYVHMALPGETETESLLMRSFTQRSEGGEVLPMRAFMVARSGPDDYGTLVVYEVPGDVDGPAKAAQNIDSDELIRREITRLDNDAAADRRVTYGDLLMVPIADSFLYVRPVYLEAGGSAPQLVQVAVQANGDTVMRPTFREALEELFEGVDVDTFEEDKEPPESDPDDPDDPPTSSTTTTTPPGETSTTSTTIPPSGDRTVAQLLADAEAKFAQADDVLRTEGIDGLSEYVDLLGDARQLVQQALFLAANTVEPPPDGPPASDTTVPVDPEASSTTTTAPPAPT